MIVEKTALDGVLLIQPLWFEDHRGEYVELYNREAYCQQGIEPIFVSDTYSRSTRNVLRGIHADPGIAKLITCLLGRIYVVIVDCTTFHWRSFVLSQQNKHQIFAPPGFGVAHLVLSEEAIFHYKQSGYYSPREQLSFKWDDPRFNIWWPIKNPILSERDERGAR